MKSKLYLLTAFVFALFALDTQSQSLTKATYPVISGVNGNLGFINNKGHLTIPFTLPIIPERPYRLFRIHSLSDGLAIIALKGEYAIASGKSVPVAQYGYANKDGEIVVEPNLTLARPFSEGLAYVEDEGSSSRSGFYINNQGEKAFDLPDGSFAPQEAEYDYFYSGADFSDGFAVVTDSTGLGYLDSSGQRVSTGFGYINSNGQLAIEARFGDARKFSEGLAAVSINEKWGFIDKTGKLVIPAIYKNVGNFSEGLAAVSITNDKLGFINKQGKTVLSTKFLFVENNGEYAPYTRWGKNPNYENRLDDPDKYNLDASAGLYYSEANNGNFDTPYFSEGLYPVTFNAKWWGFINKKGRIVIPIKFKSVGNFSEGLAKVRVNRSYYFINKNGRNAFRTSYSYVSDFSNGLAMVFYKWNSADIDDSDICEDGGSKDFIIYGYINKSGKRIFLGSYEYTECYESLGDGGPAVFTLSQSADLEINSKPTGAKIYLVPFSVWDFNENLINETDSLEAYRQSTDTNSVLNVLEQVYMAVLEFKSKKLKRKIDVTNKKKNILDVNFEND